MKKIILSIFLLGTLLSASAQVPNYVPTNGLVGYWPFSGNANDVSGKGNNGTVNGATLTTDRFGNVNSAYSFDGTSNTITTSNSFCSNLNTKDVTISLWSLSKKVKQQSLFEEIPNNKTYRLNAHLNYQLLGYTLWDCGDMTAGGRLTDTISSASLNVWEHYVFIASGTTSEMKIYRNGILEKVGTYSSSYSSKGNISFGGDPKYFEGKIDDIGIWNRALTQQEINNLYNGNICYKTISVTDTLIINVKRTSLNPLAYTNTLKVYPNPTNDKITIDNGDLSKMTGYSIKIYNSIGQQLFQSNITQQQFSLDITQWGSNGIYFMELKDNNGNIVDIKKIVLQ
jgi:hypothetical protein